MCGRGCVVRTDVVVDADGDGGEEGFEVQSRELESGSQWQKVEKCEAHCRERHNGLVVVLEVLDSMAVQMEFGWCQY